MGFYQSPVLEIEYEVEKEAYSDFNLKGIQEMIGTSHCTGI